MVRDIAVVDLILVMHHEDHINVARYVMSQLDIATCFRLTPVPLYILLEQTITSH
jgi:hypothetical protein